MTQSPTSNFDGAIAAANSVLASQGYGIKDYPSNMGGLISAILNLKKPPSNTGITVSNWSPEINEQGEIIGDTFDPAPPDGTLWFDTRQGRLMVWVTDGFYQANGTDRFAVISDTAPTSGVEGQTWYRPDTGIYYLFNGSTWVPLTGGTNSFAELSSEIIILQTQLDELSVRRSAGRDYKVFNPSASPIAPLGKIVANSHSTDQINQISIGAQDANNILSQPGLVGDLIDIETSDGDICRYSISTVNQDSYSVNHVFGVRTLTLDEDIKVYVYPQNSDYATIAYTTDQISGLQDQIDAFNAATGFDDYTAVMASVQSLSVQVGAISAGATQGQMTAIQGMIDANTGLINTANSNISGLTSQVTNLSDSLANYVTTTDFNTLDGTVTTNAGSISTLNTSVNTLQSSYTQITDSLLPEIEGDINTIESDLMTMNRIHYSSSAPTASVKNGDFWFDSTNLRVLVYSQDVWINPDRSVGGGVLVDEKQIYYSNTAPTGAYVNEGDLWFDHTNLRLKVYHQNTWIITDQAADASKALIVDAAQQTSDFASFRQYIIDNA